jgi:hypothetical protein
MLVRTRELQVMKDCLVEGARIILSKKEIEEIDNQLSLNTDPSVRFFGLKWRTVFRVCKKIFQEMTTFWTLLEKTHTVTAIMLARTLSALDMLEDDFGNHDIAVHEKRFIVEELEIEGGQKQGRRRKSCYQYKDRQGKARSRQKSFSLMGRKPKDRCSEEEDSGIETNNADSNYADDRKSQEEVKNMIGSTHTKKTC